MKYSTKTGMAVEFDVAELAFLMPWKWRPTELWGSMSGYKSGVRNFHYFASLLFNGFFLFNKFLDRFSVCFTRNSKDFEQIDLYNLVGSDGITKRYYLFYKSLRKTNFIRNTYPFRVLFLSMPFETVHTYSYLQLQPKKRRKVCR